jgi:hypothetical protein
MSLFNGDMWFFRWSRDLADIKQEVKPEDAAPWYLAHQSFLARVVASFDMK